MDTASLVKSVIALLEVGRFQEVLALPDNKDYASIFAGEYWALAPLVLEKIQDETIVTWPAMRTTCEKLLHIIASRSDPDDCIIGTVELTERAKNDAQFVCLLEPMKISVSRGSEKYIRALDWGLCAIRHYLKGLPLPSDLNLEDRERDLVDCDPSARRIVHLYAELPRFYGYFVAKFAWNGTRSKHRNVLVCFLVDILGQPLAYLPLELNHTGESRGESQARTVARRIFVELCSLQGNLYFFVQYVREKCRPSAKPDTRRCADDDPVDTFLVPDRLSPISLGVLYYLLFCGSMPEMNLPLIYSPVYLFQELLALAIIMLADNHCLLQYKGLRLVQALMNNVSGTAPASLLSSDSFALLKSLCSVMVFPRNRAVRKFAVALFKDFIMKFDDKGRHTVFSNLYPCVQQPQVGAYIIDLYRNALAEAYESKDPQRLFYFQGKYLLDFMRMTCVLTDGAKTDLSTSNATINSCLNLLRYLCMRDRTNSTGVWDHIPYLRTAFLDVLREAILLSRMEFENLLNRPSTGFQEVSNIRVSVGNTPLEGVTEKQYLERILSALNGLDILDLLLSRIQECICHRSVPVQKLY